jgi:AraC family transcriptional activator of tynA and feaB
LETKQGARLLVTIQDEGISVISQDGRSCELIAGRFCLVDPVRRFYIETDQIRTRSVYLDRSYFVSTCSNVDALTARSIDGHAGAGALFRSMIDEVFRLAPHLDESTADSIADVLPSVFMTAFQFVTTEVDTGGSRLRLFHKQRIKRYARGSLRDPQLGLDMISHGVQLSRRYITELHSREPLTLMKWVWAERMTRCARDLRDIALNHRSISEIAYSWGFSDMAHFSRAFRATYLLSPREYRKRQPHS